MLIDGEVVSEPASAIPPTSLYHVQPFVWSQIQRFIESFYRLHDGWKQDRERGTAEFNRALRDPGRAFLLNLARRPIFLTLMALVHVNDRRMPHGRGDLYRRIIDLYLIRQTHYRRVQATQQGTPMPHWDERELRRALGYLAWRSQQRGSEADKADERDQRQVVWSRTEMRLALTGLLAGEAGQGRFREIKPEQAQELLDYYLHPTGLLIEPAEGRVQFAHLSFQEYLCAEYIHGRALDAGSRGFLDAIRDQLYAELGRPGWDEVGMLLLTIHAAQGAQTSAEAHLELLAELDPTDLPQARLLLAAPSGGELDYSDAERRRWLPLAVAACLIHPEEGLAVRLGTVTAWRKPGAVLLLGLFRADNQWVLLQQQLAASPPASMEGWLEKHPMSGDMAARWLGFSLEDLELEGGQAQDWSLLALIGACAWRGAESVDAGGGLDDGPLADAVAEWLASRPWTLYPRGEQGRPMFGAMEDALEALIPDQGRFWRALLSRLPVDRWLLEGETTDAGMFSENSRPSLLLSLYPEDALPAPSRAALGLYQALLLVEALVANGAGLTAFMEQRSRSLSRSRSRSRSLSLSGSGSGSLPLPLPLPLSQSQSQSQSQSLSLSRETGLSDPLRSLLRRFAGVASDLPEEAVLRSAKGLALFGYRHAALDWFDEQAEDPALMKARGLRPGQPLPPKLGLFDADGRPRSPLPRTALVALGEWLRRPDDILAWFFPKDLSAVDRADLLEQLAILDRQPWSPQAAVAALLQDWPEDEPERDTTLAAAEAPLIALLQELLPPETDADG